VPVEPTLVILAIAVIANFVILLVAFLPAWLGRRSPLQLGMQPRNRAPRNEPPMPAERVLERLDRVVENGRDHMPMGPIELRATELRTEPPLGGRGGWRPGGGGEPLLAPDTMNPSPAQDAGRAPSPYDRIVRIVAMVFILGAITVVTASGVWAQAQNQIVLLLVVAGLVVIVVHDLLPAEAFRSAKFGLEAAMGIVLATYLVLLTGRQFSPFFLAFPLLVAGAALVVSPRATLILAALASLGYIIGLAVVPGGDLGPGTVSTISVQVMSLVLLAYVAMVIARMQRRSRDAAIRMSTIDALTGLYNRPFLFSSLEQEIARSTRTGRGFCLLMMDLDELKTINDRYGHFVGDRALRAVADVIRFGVRRIDIPARYGGDEFVVLLPETDPTGGYVLGEKMRQSVAELVVPGTEVRTSMSVGMVSYPDDGRTADELMISADRAMYASKRLGKNRVMGAPTGAGGRADAPV
jgi:diguanylate cyclase (GGDEF)-like protein